MRATIKGLRIAVIALGCYWVVLFITTHIPANQLPSLQVNDKLVHAGAFAVLAFLLAWALPTIRRRPLRNVLIAGGIGTLYAAVDELLQMPVGRTADWFDFWADCVGIVFGLWLYTAIRSHLIRRQIQLFERAAG